MSKDRVACTISEINYRKVLIEFKDQIKITKSIIREIYELDKGDFIEDGNLVWWEDTHGSGITHTIRIATPGDITGVKLLEEIDAWGKKQ